MTTAGPHGGQGELTLRDWLAVGGGILGAFMAILDIQITNASLAEIGGTIGATPSEGSWISTGYLMAEIVIIPLTGWLARTFGLRRFLSVASMAFVGFSVLCALSNSLPEMILWRAGQGITGGVLIPTAITIVRTRLPADKQPMGVAMFGMVATFAPAIGPTVGGWLTENWSWHYVFYLNVVPGIAAIAIQLYALDKERPHFGEFFQADWLGIAGMAIGFSSLIFVLEEGQREEWFDSRWIVAAAIASFIGIAVFLIAELTTDKPFINLRLFAKPAVGGSGILMAVFGATAFGSVYLIPSYLAQVQGYNAQQIGEVVMWSGIPQLFLLPVMPFLMKRVDLRLLVGMGRPDSYACKIEWLERQGRTGPSPEAKVKVGDEVVTSGLGASFPAGLVVGKVSRIAGDDGMFQSVEVQPTVDVSRVRAVMVLLAPPPPPDPDAKTKKKSEPAFGGRAL